ncbi:hypothetical protein D3C80_1285990 [compost metagenome]
MQRLVFIGGVRVAVAQLLKCIEPGLAQQAFEFGDQCLDPQGLTVRCNRQALDFSAIGAFMGCKQMVLIAFAKVQCPTMSDEVRHRQACQGRVAASGVGEPAVGAYFVQPLEVVQGSLQQAACLRLADRASSQHIRFHVRDQRRFHIGNADPDVGL